MKTVTVWGDSVTGLACAYLLGSQGYCVQLVRSEQHISPPVLLTEEAIFLLKEIFGNLEQLDNFLVHSTHRIISGNHGETTVLLDNSFSCQPFELIKVLLQCLVSRFNSTVKISSVADYNENNVNIIADASFRDKYLSTECTRFGHRFVYSRMITDLKQQNSSTSYMEIRANSWSFSFPLMNGERCVQIMSPIKFADTAQIRNFLEVHLKKLGICTILPDFQLFDAAPTIYTLTKEAKTWLVGNALSKYDPVSGNATANYLRSALLLSAVLKKDDSELTATRDYYYTRVQYGMRLHLNKCDDFYNSSFYTNCWNLDEVLIKNWVGTQLKQERAVQQYFLHLA